MRDTIDQLLRYWAPEHLPFLTKVPAWAIYAAAMLAVCGVMLGVAAGFAGIGTFLERRIAGRMQARIGPNRVGPFGLLQFLADGVKLLFKEDIIPAESDSILFRLAPYVVFFGSFPIFAALPFTQGLPVYDTSTQTWGPAAVGTAAANLNVGIFYVISLSSTVVIGILMAGWASGNKWALFGAMRSAAQIVSYEIPVGLAIMTVIMMTGSMNLQEIVGHQSGGFWNWNAFRLPYVLFTFPAMIVYFVGGMAEANRTPFDIPEAESELVAGYHVEYSGMRFGFFFMAEYANMLAVGIIASTLFLGGWQSPLGRPILPGWGAYLEGFLWYIGKSFFWVFVMMWLRWTLPRYRVDQLMHLCWKVLIPVALACFLGVGILAGLKF